MKIVGICACTAGIAHTYIAREKLIKAAETKNHEIFLETQGTIGTEFALTQEQIENADVVLLVVDIMVSEDRFKNKKIMRIPTNLAIKGPKQIITKLEEVI